MRIGELANRLGVSGDTVRFYERAGWLPSAPRQDNGYRDYREEDVEHLRLLVDLRRMDLPLDTAARLASWCHSGHCEETTAELPRELAEKRREIADRIDNLRSLDGRLAQLE
jgi:DNA-binding transcriptional MerR regulator